MKTCSQERALEAHFTLFKVLMTKPLRVTNLVASIAPNNHEVFQVNLNSHPPGKSAGDEVVSHNLTDVGVVCFAASTPEKLSSSSEKPPVSLPTLRYKNQLLKLPSAVYGNRGVNTRVLTPLVLQDVGFPGWQLRMSRGRVVRRRAMVVVIEWALIIQLGCLLTWVALETARLIGRAGFEGAKSAALTTLALSIELEVRMPQLGTRFSPVSAPQYRSRSNHLHAHGFPTWIVPW